jgi:small-conductance mechanosensitive channel
VELLQVGIAFLASSVFANLVRFFVITAYRKRNSLPVGEHNNFVLGIDSLSTLIVFLFTLFTTFAIFNIPFQTFLTSVSLVAVALVLIFRDYISNYLDSFRLMFSSDYRIGDYIKVSEFTKGNILDISFRATKLKTDEGDVLYIPNTKLMTSEVVNYSKVKFKRIIVPFSLPTGSFFPLDYFESQLKGHLMQKFPDLVQESKMFLRILNVKDWQTSFAFEVSVNTYNFSIEDQITKEVYSFALTNHTQTATPKVILKS